jgi:heptosyltransferase II
MSKTFDFQNAPVRLAKRILVMRYRFIGDTVLMIPFLRNLRQACPDAIIDVLVAPDSGEILKYCPYINELIVFDTRSFLEYAKSLRERRYDWAFVLKRSFSSAMLAFLANIPNRVGFSTECRGLLLTHRVPYLTRKKGTPVHERDAFLSVLTHVHIPVTDRSLESWFSEEDEAVAKRKILATTPAEGIPVVVHLTSSNAGKQWTEAQSVVFLEKLLSHSAVVVHCLGTQADRALYQNLLPKLSMSAQKRFYIHCGQFSLLESMAFLKQMRCVIGVDSGTLHMAAAVGTTVIALFGPMDEQQWAPIGSAIVTHPLDCRPCHLKKPCPHDFDCMKSLSPDRVMEVLKTHVNLV